MNKKGQIYFSKDNNGIHRTLTNILDKSMKNSYPKSYKEWSSHIETAFGAGALITDVLFTRGILQFLMGTAQRIRSNKAIKELKNLSEENKKEIREKISKEYLKSQDFLVFLSNIMIESIRLKNAEKAKYFKSAMINGMINNNMEEGKKNLFVECLSSLTMDSILLIGTIDRLSSKENNKSNLTFSVIREKTKYDDYCYLMANLKTLERYNLVEIYDPQSKMPFYGNYTVIFNELGREFVSFIISYS